MGPQGVVGKRHRAVHNQVERTRCSLSRRALPDSRVVHKDVDLPKVILRCAHSIAHFLRVGDIDFGIVTIYAFF